MSKRLSWAVRLERAEKRGEFTNEDERLSGLWNRCAIGERHNFPKGESPLLYHLIDEETRLGNLFCSAICEQDIPEAKRIYAEIQALP